MGPNGKSGGRKGKAKKSRKSYVDVVQLPREQVSKESQDHINPPKIKSTDSMGEGVVPVGPKSADGIHGGVPLAMVPANLSGLNTDEKHLGSESGEAGGGRLLHLTTEMTMPEPSSNNNISRNVRPPAEAEKTARSNMEVTDDKNRERLKDSPQTSFQDTSRLNEADGNPSQQLHNDFNVKQVSLCSGKEDLVTTTKILDNENLNAVTTARFGAHDVAQAIRLKHSEVGELREVVTSLPSVGIDILEKDAEDAVRQLCHDRRGLRKDLHQCRIDVESAAQDKRVLAHELEQLKGKILVLEETTSKLQQRNDVMQQQLCKDREGHHGSYVDGLQTPSVLESTAKEVFSSISSFSHLLSKYKDRTGCQTAYRGVYESDLFRRVRTARNHHWTFLLKHFVCDHLFKNFEIETFTNSGSRVLCLNYEERRGRCINYYNQWNAVGMWSMAFRDASSDTFDCLFFEYLACSLCFLSEDVSQLTEFDFFKIGEERKGSHLRAHIKGLPLASKSLVESLIVAAGKEIPLIRITWRAVTFRTIFSGNPSQELLL